jgi:hypothetical protein
LPTRVFELGQEGHHRHPITEPADERFTPLPVLVRERGIATSIQEIDAMPSRRFTLSSLAAAAALIAALPAARATILADADRPVDVQIVDRMRGRPLPLIDHRGTAWVAGQPGDRYAVRLSNRTNARVMVVLSVDGVNVVSGETAAIGQVGYVLSPWQTFDVSGWRKSDQETAAFYFTSIADSYAGRTARPQNVGVIGAAVFRERVVARSVPAPVEPWSSGRDGRDTEDRSLPRRSEAGPTADSLAKSAAGSAAPPPVASPAPAQREDAAPRGRSFAPNEATAMARQESRLGTGHGERVWSPIQHTSFERASSRPADVVQIRYDSHQNLLAAGILPQPRPLPRPNPNPFRPTCPIRPDGAAPTRARPSRASATPRPPGRGRRTRAHRPRR